MGGKQNPRGEGAKFAADAALVDESAESNAAAESPPTLDSITGYLLRRGHYLYNTYWGLHFLDGKSSMTPMQSGMLTMLRRYPGITQTELAKRMGVEVPTAFKALKRLEESGYLERVADKPDKRARTLKLTTEGDRILKDVDAFNPVRDHNLLADFTPAERAQFKALLAKLIVRGAEHLGISQDVVIGAQPDAELPTAGIAGLQRNEPNTGFSEPGPKRHRVARWRSRDGLRKRTTGFKS